MERSFPPERFRKIGKPSFAKITMLFDEIRVEKLYCYICRKILAGFSTFHTNGERSSLIFPYGNCCLSLSLKHKLLVLLSKFVRHSTPSLFSNTTKMVSISFLPPTDKFNVVRADTHSLYRTLVIPSLLRNSPFNENRWIENNSKTTFKATCC